MLSVTLDLLGDMFNYIFMIINAVTNGQGIQF